MAFTDDHDQFPCEGADLVPYAEGPRTVVQRIRDLAKSKEDRLLEKYGVTRDGKITSQGAQVLMEKLLPAHKKAIAADLQKIEDEKKAKKK